MSHENRTPNRSEAHQTGREYVEVFVVGEVLAWHVSH